jgi:hypothetical protein
MKTGGVLSELEHFTKHGNFAGCLGFQCEHLERAMQRARARVVRVIDQRDAAAQLANGSAPIGRDQPPRGSDDVLEGNAGVECHRGSGEHVGEIATAEQRCVHLDLPCWRCHPRAHALHAAVLDIARANGRAVRQSEGHDTAGKRARSLHDSPIVGIADQHRRRVGALENLSLGVGDGIGGLKEPEVRIAYVRPHAHVGRGNVDERADLPGVIHSQFHHRDIGQGAQLNQ